MTAQQQTYRAPAARCPSWCTVPAEVHRAERAVDIYSGSHYSHRREVYRDAEIDWVDLVWCPDNDWDPADPNGTDEAHVHAQIVVGNDDGYTAAEARALADRLVRAAEAIREAAGLLEAGVQ